MTDIQILAATEQDYPFSTLFDDQSQAYRRLFAMGWTRLQIQSAIVKELHKQDGQAWAEFQSLIESNAPHQECVYAQDKTYRIRARLNACSNELNRRMRRPRTQLAA